MRSSYPPLGPLLSSLMQQALFKCEMPRLELKSLQIFLLLKCSQRTKIGKVIKLTWSSLKKWSHILCVHRGVPDKLFLFYGDWPWSDVVLHGNYEQIFLKTFSFSPKKEWEAGLISNECGLYGMIDRGSRSISPPKLKIPGKIISFVWKNLYKMYV